jgi:hypothetical protein
MGHDCVAFARELFRHRDRDQAIVVAYTACLGGEGEACMIAADVLDSAHGSRYGGRWTPPVHITQDSKELRARGVDALDAACAKDDGAACLALGSVKLHGRHGLGDPAVGKHLVSHACDLGQADACVIMASKQADAKHAIALLERACTGGNHNGCVALGEHIVTKDATRAQQLFAAACTADVAAGCVAQGEFDKRAGKLELASTELQKGCELETGPSCTAAGKLVEAKQPELARTLYTTACDDDEGPACSGLAALVAAGKGGERDWGNAIVLFGKACKLAAPHACADEQRTRAHPPDWHCTTEVQCKKQCDETIGKSCTRYGEVVSGHDCPAAFAAFATACTLGDPRGCRLSANHAGDTEALALYTTACKQGDPESCILAAAVRVQAGDHAALAELETACAAHRADACVWFAGLGDLPDKRTFALLRPACDNSDARACRLLGEHTGRLDPSTATLADVKVADEQARALLGKACTLGDAVACAMLAPGDAAPPVSCVPDDIDWEHL